MAWSSGCWTALGCLGRGMDQAKAFSAQPIPGPDGMRGRTEGRPPPLAPHHLHRKGGQVKPAARTGGIWGRLEDHHGAASSKMRS